MPDSKAEDPAAVLEALLRLSFVAFLQKAWPYISGGEPLVMNWHILAIAHQLNRVEDGGLLRLIAALPPRYGKSKIISVIWVAWMLGRDPTRSFVCVSYSNELSGKLARDCLTIMQSAWYRKLFPKTVVSVKRSAAYDFDTTAGGGRLATSVSGTLTGRGGDYIILDDVMKPEEANSEGHRNSLHEWFQSTLASRLNDKSSGVIILVMQRLHEDDLVGRLTKQEGWHLLKLPAISTTDQLIPLTNGITHLFKAGEVLHTEREPREVLDALRNTMGSYAFAAQYLQDPVPAVGNIIQAHWFKRYGWHSLDLRQGQIVMSLDTASKDNPHNDYTACVVARVWRGDVYVLEVVRERLQMPQLLKRVIALADKHRPHVLLIEDQASGTQLIQLLEASRHPGAPRPIGRRPEGDKASRVLGITPMIESGRLFLPEDAPWLADFAAELLAFPNGRHDDQVDALTQLMIWVRQGDRYPIPRVMPWLGVLEDEDFPSELMGN